MIRRGIRRLFRLPPQREEQLAEDVEAEIRLHLRLREEELMRRGLSSDAARVEARRRFGAPQRAHRELYRMAKRREDRMRLRERLDAIGQDLAYALRGILRERGTSLVIVVTLALGIGANAAVFGIVDRLLLSGPEHVQDSERIVRLYLTNRTTYFGERTSAYAGYVLYTGMRDRARSFESVAAYQPPSSSVLRAGTDAEEVQVSGATWDLFPLLGVQPLLGRFFLELEDQPPEGEPLAVLGYALWQTRFGGDAAVLGRSIELGPRTYTIVGVAPPGFTGPQFERVDVWTPMAASRTPRPDWPTTWNAAWLHIVGRLAPGTTADQATTEVNAVFRQVYDGEGESLAEARLSLASLRHDTAGHEPLEASVSRWVFAVALVLLLIACANVASLHLARGARREREVAVRLALGIGRGRLVTLLLAQSLLLALAGGAAALVLAHWGGGVLRQVLAPSVAWSGSPVDARVFAFTFAITAVTGVLTGLLPGVHAFRRKVTGALRSGAREGGVRRSRSLGALTVAQAAAATVLLIGAGLFARSLAKVLSLPLGIEPDRVLAVGGERLTPGGAAAFYAEGLDRMRALPAVEAAALAIGTPFLSSFGVSLRVAGRDSIPQMPGGGPYISAITSDYFTTVGTRLLRGRPFTPEDRADSEPVTIVTETMAEALWPAGDPLGRCLHIGSGDAPCSRIVGVVEEAKRRSLHDEPAMQYYVPFGQERGIGGTTLLVRPNGDVAAALPEIRAALQELAGPSAFLRISTLQERIDPEIRPWRTGATLSSLFGALALAVAAFGLFSVIAFVVAQRTHEVGVRMALGARRAQVGRMMLRQGMALVLAGLAIGMLLVVGLRRFIEPALFQVSPLDPLVLTGVAGLVVVVTVAAALLPAVHAARVDPVIALRAE